MKVLYLMRHGHADSKTVQPDIKRKLDAEGRKEVAEMCGKMVKAGMKPEHFISSNATRAYQTAEIMAQGMAIPVKNIMIDEGIYHTDAQGLLDIIAQQEDKFHHMLMAGHNPSVSQLALILCPQLQEGMPTASIAALRSESNSWDKFSEFQVSLVFFSWPGSGPIPDTGSGSQPEPKPQF